MASQTQQPMHHQHQRTSSFKMLQPLSCPWTTMAWNWTKRYLRKMKLVRKVNLYRSKVNGKAVFVLSLPRSLLDSWWWFLLLWAGLVSFDFCSFKLFVFDWSRIAETIVRPLILCTRGRIWQSSEVKAGSIICTERDKVSSIMMQWYLVYRIATVEFVYNDRAARPSSLDVLMPKTTLSINGIVPKSKRCWCAN